MEYIWQQYHENNKYRLAKPNGQAYSEVEGNVNDFIEINPLFRFQSMYEGKQLAGKEIAEEDTYRYQKKYLPEQLCNSWENISLHFLANLDFTYGLHTFLVEEEQIKTEILQGYYGSFVQKAFTKLNSEKQGIITSLLRKKRELKNSKSLFRVAVMQVLGSGKILFYDGKLLLHLQLEHTIANEEKYQLLCTLFLDMFVEIEAFWQEHVGIIEDLPTMKIDEMVIY